MSRRRPAVSLGDAISALATLRPTDEDTLREILSLVRLSPPHTTAKPILALREPPPPSEDVETPPSLVEAPDEASEEIADHSPLGAEVPSELEMQAGGAENPVTDVPPLPEDEGSWLPPIEPLFVPRWVRGIVTAALSVPFPDGPPHVERIVETVARGAAIEEVPRHAVPSLRLGVDLLVDRSARMTPFTKDQAWLELALQRIIGKGRVKLRRFKGNPRTAFDKPRKRSADGRGRPDRGRPVLALTDLGIGTPMFDPDMSDPSEWLALAHLLRRAGCPLIVFVPYPPSRWPRVLARQLNVVQWDRVTSAAAVRGSIGRAASI
jgi:hypothetical protein